MKIFLQSSVLTTTTPPIAPLAPLVGNTDKPVRREVVTMAMKVESVTRQFMPDFSPNNIYTLQYKRARINAALSN